MIRYDKDIGIDYVFLDTCQYELEKLKISIDAALWDNNKEAADKYYDEYCKLMADFRDTKVKVNQLNNEMLVKLDLI